MALKSLSEFTLNTSKVMPMTSPHFKQIFMQNIHHLNFSGLDMFSKLESLMIDYGLCPLAGATQTILLKVSGFSMDIIHWLEDTCNLSSVFITFFNGIII